MLCNSEDFAFIALGSNLGDARKNVLDAIENLRALGESPLRCSSLWQSTPVACPPGSPQFVNAVAGIRPREGETPESLLDRLQAIERAFGRLPARLRNEPRPMDLDLICFGRKTRDSTTLVLPHPRAHLRRFVMLPLSEIAPDLILPGQTLSISQLLSALDTSEELLLLPG